MKSLYLCFFLLRVQIDFDVRFELTTYRQAVGLVCIIILQEDKKKEKKLNHDCIIEFRFSTRLYFGNEACIANYTLYASFQLSTSSYIKKI